MNVKDYELERLAHYCLGRIEQQVDDYAQSSQVPGHALKHRVSQLFYANQMRQGGGSEENLPALRTNGQGAVSPGQAVELVEVHDHAHSDGSPRRGRPPKALAQGRLVVDSQGKLRDYQAEYWRRRGGNNNPGGTNGRGRGRKGLHWTQMPENRRRVLAHARKLARGRKLQAKQYPRLEKARSSRGMRGYWGKMTAEERSREMSRRKAVANARHQAEWMAKSRADAGRGEVRA